MVEVGIECARSLAKFGDTSWILTRLFSGLFVVFILERSKFELIKNGYAERTLWSGRGPEQTSGGGTELGTDEERRCQFSGVQRT